MPTTVRRSAAVAFLGLFLATSFRPGSSRADPNLPEPGPPAVTSAAPPEASTAALRVDETALAGRVDLAHWQAGGRVLEVSPPTASPTRHRLIGWEPGSFEATGAGSIRVMLGIFAPLGAVPIDGVALTLEGDVNRQELVRQVRIAVEGPGEREWIPGSFMLPADPGHYLLSFPARPAQRVIFQFDANHGELYFAVGRLRVLEAVPEGARSKLEAHRPEVVDSSILEGRVDLVGIQQGGRVSLAPSTYSESSGASRLLWPGGEHWESALNTTQTTMSIAIHRDLSPVPVDTIVLAAAPRLDARCRPRQVDLSLEGAEGWSPLGQYLLPRAGDLLAIRFPPRPARALRLEVRGSHGGSQVGLGRVHLLEARPGPGENSVLERIQARPIEGKDIVGREDLLSLENGGRVAVEPATYPGGGHDFRNLLRDGEAWWSQSRAFGTTAVLEIHPLARTPWVDTVVLTQHPSSNEAERLLEVGLATSKAPGAELEPLGTWFLTPRQGLHAISFPPRQARSLAVELRRNRGGAYIQLGRVQLLEASAAGEPPVLDELRAKPLPEIPPGRTDLASRENGGRLTVAPAADYGPYSAWNLLEATADGWRSQARPGISTAVIEVYPELATPRVDSIAFTQVATARSPEWIREVRLATQEKDGASWDPLGTFMLPREVPVSLVPFGPRAARRLRVELLSSRGEYQMSLARLHWLEAASDLDHSVMTKARATEADPTWLKSGRNLASPGLGAIAFASGEYSATHSADKILDGDPGTWWADRRRSDSSRVIGVELPDLGAPLSLGSLALLLQDPVQPPNFPRDLAIEVSVEGIDRGYQRVRRVLVPRRSGWHRVDFPEVPARWVRLIPLENHGGEFDAINELMLFEGTSGPSALDVLTATPVDPASIARRLDLLSHARGARVVSPGDPAAGVLAIESAGTLLRDVDDDWGWRPRGRLPFEAIFDLPGSDPQRVSTLVFEAARDPRGYHPDLSDSSSRVQVVEVAHAMEISGPFTSLGKILLAREVPVQRREHSPFDARFLKLVLHGNHGGKSIHLGRLRALPPDDSILTGPPPVDLLPHAHGGNLILFDRQGAEPGVLTREGDQGHWTVDARDGISTSLVWGFRFGRAARFDRIEVVLPPEEAGSWPAAVELATGTGGALGPFTRVHRLELAPGNNRPLSSFVPVEAPLVRVTFVPRAGASTIAVSRVRLYEAPDSATGSILEQVEEESTTPREDTSAVGLREGATPPGFELEPNDEPGKAMPLSTGVPVTGTIQPGSDVDHFTFEDAVGTGYDIVLEQQPFLRIGARVTGPGGEELARLEPGENSSPRFQRTLVPGSGTSLLRIDQPPSSILMVFDSSGSMKPAYQDIEAAATGFFRSLSGKEEVATSLIGSGALRLLTDFTSDKHTLETSTVPHIGDGGSSEATAAVVAGLERLRDRPGNRALVILSDFQEKGVPVSLWKLASQVGARIYTVGFAITHENEWRAEIGNTQEQYMKNLARATGGLYLRAPRGEVLSRLYQQIAEDLSSSTPYTVEVKPPSLPGKLAVSFASREMARRLGSERRILIVLDVSGSMKYPVKGSPDRRKKIEIARDVIGRLVKELPDGIHLGLRVYGHRHSPKDSRTCQDRELIVPIAPLQREKFQQVVNRLSPRGETPMIDAVLDAKQDFAGTPPGPRTVVLISDGLETCRGEPESVATLRASGIDLIEVNVVGFGIDDPAAVDQLTRIAKAGGGVYHDARDPVALARALSRTTAVPFRLLGKDGTLYAEGTVGHEPISWFAGEYRLEVRTIPPITMESVKILPGRVTAISLGDPGER